MNRFHVVLIGACLSLLGVQPAAAQSAQQLLDTALGDDVPSYGASGSQVTKLQQFLNSQRRSRSLSPIAVDGHFGPTTLAALKYFEAGSPPPPKTLPPAPPARSTAVSNTAANRVLPSGGIASRGTGYYPANTKLEGGSKDRVGHPLYTLQEYLAGKAPYVAVAMDPDAFPYGTALRIPELEREYGRAIDFRVVDTGSAFDGKGTSRIDICTQDHADSLDPVINGPLHLVRPSIGIVGALGRSQ